MKYLSAKEVCSKIGISPSTLYRWIDPKSAYYDSTFPPPVKLGLRNRRYSSVKVDKWISEKSNESEQPIDAADETIPLTYQDSRDETE